jgi:hypothetical protein
MGPSTRLNLSRRDLLKLSAAGALCGSSAGWFDLLAAQAAKSPDRPKRAKSCILLWMGGGPSQIDTFDMKPGTQHGGPYRPIATKVPGLQVCEHLPKLAQLTDKMAFLRGMCTGEGDHSRGTYQMRTGYRLLPGTDYPPLGSIVSAEVGSPEADLPHFFWLAGGLQSAGGGYLGARHAPVPINEVREKAEENLQDVRPIYGLPTFDQQIGLLDQLEKRFLDQHHGARPLADHRTMVHQAARLMHSSKIGALDLTKEPSSVREAYGPTPFGKACLLARRLVEAGVSFVGVNSGMGWDHHHSIYKLLTPNLQVLDRAWSALLRDLDTRGLLDSTLVVWMGEFGRSAQLVGKEGPGREHNAAAWTTVLAGGGIRTGQAIGNTGKTGVKVEDRPISTADFMATICEALGIDWTKENLTPDRRPIRITDKGARPVAELFG